jgi:uncharacterized protein YndB with AHSA1/START domain
MGPVTAETTIDAPRERVYATIADLSMRPAFTDHFMKEFRLQRIEPRGIGAAARFHLDAPRFPIWMESVISELEPPHMIVERGKGSRSDRMPIVIAWELVENSRTMTDVSVSFWTEPGHVTDKIKDRMGSSGWHRRQWRRALGRLRDLLESDVPIEALHVAGASRP